MSIWDNIVATIQNTLETTSDADLNTSLTYTKQLIFADTLASSIFNGTYFIRLRGINRIDDSVNSRFTAFYRVTIELCYAISAGDSIKTYNDAMEDVEVIISNMSQQAAWSAYNNIQLIRVENLEEPRTILKGEIFMIVPINFEIQTIITY